MIISEKKYTLKDLHIGMMAKAEQLTEIYNKYMILRFFCQIKGHLFQRKTMSLNIVINTF